MVKILEKIKRIAITRILDKEDFEYNESDVKNLFKSFKNNKRYGFAVLTRKEDQSAVKRFIKIVLDNKLITRKLLRRQTIVTQILSNDHDNSMKVVGSSFNPLIPYVILSSKKGDEEYGFLDNTISTYEKFHGKQIKSLVDEIYSFHSKANSLKSDDYKYFQHIKTDSEHYMQELKKMFSKRVFHKFENSRAVRIQVVKLIQEYTKIKNLEEVICVKYNSLLQIIETQNVNKNKFLVHADLAIDNVFLEKGSQVELIDFEWVGLTSNKYLALVYDFGNLHAKAWESPEFQQGLEHQVLEKGIQYYKTRESVQAAIQIAKLRSSILMLTYWSDYDLHKKWNESEEVFYDRLGVPINTIKDVLDMR